MTSTVKTTSAASARHTARMDLRMSIDLHTTLAQVAAHQGVTVGQFVLANSLEAAQRVVDAHDGRVSA